MPNIHEIFKLLITFSYNVYHYFQCLHILVWTHKRGALVVRGTTAGPAPLGRWGWFVLHSWSLLTICLLYDIFFVKAPARLSEKAPPSGRAFTHSASIAQMILPKTSVFIGPRRSSRPTVTNNKLPYGTRTNDPLVAREKRPTSTNDNRCFFAISFGLIMHHLVAVLKSSKIR